MTRMRRERVVAARWAILVFCDTKTPAGFTILRLEWMRLPALFLFSHLIEERYRFLDWHEVKGEFGGGWFDAHRLLEVGVVGRNLYLKFPISWG